MKRLCSGFAMLALLAACGPQRAPAPGPAPEKAGRDEPGAPAAPTPDPRPMTFEAMSRTAEAFTGAITLTAEPRAGANAPPAMKLVGASGLTLFTELIPGGAAQATGIDWKALFGEQIVATGNATPGAPSIDVHTVLREEVPASAPNGGFCGPDTPTTFLAMATGLVAQGQPFMGLAAFRGDVWPPAGMDALCGTFNYIPPAPPL